MTVNVSIHHGVDAEVLAWIAREAPPQVDPIALYRKRLEVLERLRIIVDSAQSCVTVGK